MTRSPGVGSQARRLSQSAILGHVGFPERRRPSSPTTANAASTTAFGRRCRARRAAARSRCAHDDKQESSTTERSKGNHGEQPGRQRTRDHRGDIGQKLQVKIEIHVAAVSAGAVTSAYGSTTSVTHRALNHRDARSGLRCWARRQDQQHEHQGRELDGDLSRPL